MFVVIMESCCLIISRISITEVSMHVALMNSTGLEKLSTLTMLSNVSMFGICVGWDTPVSDLHVHESM